MLNVRIHVAWFCLCASACHSTPAQAPALDGSGGGAGTAMGEQQHDAVSEVGRGGDAVSIARPADAGARDAPVATQAMDAAVDAGHPDDVSAGVSGSASAGSGGVSSSVSASAGSAGSRAGESSAAGGGTGGTGAGPTMTAAADGAAGTAGQAGAAGAGSTAGSSGAGESGAGGNAASGAGQGGRAGVAGGGRRRFCLPPSTCVPVDTLAVSLELCCPDNGEDCGYAVARPADLDDGTCKPVGEIFQKQPGQEEQRVVTQGAPDQLITPDCETRTLLAFSLPGCCMRNNRCGVSTYEVADILLGLALIPAPYTQVECVSTQELNFQFRLTTLAGLGQVPESSSSCNYADLDARLER